MFFFLAEFQKHHENSKNTMGGLLSRSLNFHISSISPSFCRHGLAAASSLAEPHPEVSSLASAAAILGSINPVWAESRLKVSTKASSAATESSINHTLAEPHLKAPSFNVPKATYPTRSTAPLPSDPLEVKTIATQAVNDTNAIFLGNDYEKLRSLFLTESCYWKDHLGPTSTRFVTLDGVNQIIPLVSQHLSHGGRCLRNFKLEKGKEPQVTNLGPPRQYQKHPSIHYF